MLRQTLYKTVCNKKYISFLNIQSILDGQKAALPAPSFSCPVEKSQWGFV